MSARTRHLFAFSACALLAVVFTWPLAAHMNASFPSAGVWTAGDPEMFIWWFDVAAKSLRGALPTAASKMLFWPNGINLLAGYDGPLMLAVGVPLTLLFGNPVLAYDLFILTALAGSAFAAYLLGMRLTRSWPAAMLVGFLFGLSPYMLVRAAQHPNLLMTGTLPLLLLAAFRWLDRPKDKSSYAWLALAAAANAASSWYYAIAGLIFLAILFLFQADTWRKNAARLIAAVAAVGVGTGIVALPLLFSPTGGSAPSSAAFVARMGAKPIDFILPNALTNVFGDLRRGLRDDPPASDTLPTPNVFERSSYFGIPLLVLVAIFAWRRRTSTLPVPAFWICALITFTLLSLGTEVTVLGQHLPMPFALLRGLFPFSLARVPNRFFVGALLCAAVMAGDVAARWLAQKRLLTFANRATAACFGIMFVAERLIFPYPIFTQEVSSFFVSMAADRDFYAVADLPIPYTEFSEFDYYQIHHGKPTTGGAYYYPAYTPEVLSFIRKNPLLAASLCTPRLPHPNPIDLAREVWPAFRGQNVRYVIIHNLLLHDIPECAGIQQTLRETFRELTPYFADGDITVYRVPAPNR